MVISGDRGEFSILQITNLQHRRQGTARGPTWSVPFRCPPSRPGMRATLAAERGWRARRPASTSMRRTVDQPASVQRAASNGRRGGLAFAVARRCPHVRSAARISRCARFGSSAADSAKSKGGVTRAQAARSTDSWAVRPREPPVDLDPGRRSASHPVADGRMQSVKGAQVEVSDLQVQPGCGAEWLREPHVDGASMCPHGEVRVSGDVVNRPPCRRTEPAVDVQVLRGARQSTRSQRTRRSGDSCT